MQQLQHFFPFLRLLICGEIDSLDPTQNNFILGFWRLLARAPCLHYYEFQKQKKNLRNSNLMKSKKKIFLQISSHAPERISSFCLLATRMLSIHISAQRSVLLQLLGGRGSKGLKNNSFWMQPRSFIFDLIFKPPSHPQLLAQIFRFYLYPLSHIKCPIIMAKK